MSSRPVRLLHAGQFRLEQPLGGITDVPDVLRDALVEAPFRSAERVFDAALSTGVDALVLTGDLADASWTGPRGPRFLVEQCERLHARQIDVLWATGATDSADAWPMSSALPPNVHRFRADRPEEIVVRREGVVRARVIGLSQGVRHARLDEFRPAGPDGVVVAVTVGAMELIAEAARGVHYVALGERSDRGTLQTSPCVVHDSGSPQGRNPSEAGPHGATLVDLVAGSPARLQFVPTDAVRYLSARVNVEPSTSRDQLERMLDAKLEELATSNPGQDLLVTWTIGGRGPLLPSLRRTSLAEDVLAGLNRVHGRRSPPAWSIALTALPEPLANDEILEQDSLLGEFLRTVERRQKAERPEEEFWNLTASLVGPDAQPYDDDLVPVLSVPDAATRRELLRQSAILGTDLLTGDRRS